MIFDLDCGGCEYVVGMDSDQGLLVDDWLSQRQKRVMMQVMACRRLVDDDVGTQEEHVLVPQQPQQQHYPLDVIPTMNHYYFDWRNQNFVVQLPERHGKDDDADLVEKMVVMSFFVLRRHHTTTILRRDLRIQRYEVTMRLLDDIHRRVEARVHNHNCLRSERWTNVWV